MLLTRSPLSPGPKPWFSLDLHVLSAPPAFVLSQDQTLREENMCPSRRKDGSFSSSSMLDRLPKEKKTGSFPLAGARTSRAAGSSSFELDARSSSQKGRRVLPPAGSSQIGQGRREVSTFCTLLSFQRPCRWAGDKKASARARGLREGTTKLVSARSKALQLSSDRLLVPPCRAAEGW